MRLSCQAKRSLRYLSFFFFVSFQVTHSSVQAYNAAAECIQKAKPELLAAFQKSCGFGLGLEFRDSSLLITAKNERAVRQGMVFNVSLGLHNLQLANQTNELKKTYSLVRVFHRKSISLAKL